MKNIFIILFLFINVVGFGQFTNNQTIGAPPTLVYSRGGFRSDSGMIISNLDTSLIRQLNYYDGTSGKGSGLVFYQDSYYMRYNGEWVRLTNQNDISAIFGCYTLLSGGEVTWDSLLVFHVAPATYTINCKLYTSRDTTLTLSVAPATQSRIDVIAVDTLGRAVIVKGDSAVNPEQPQVDPSSQLELTSILVTPGATTPSTPSGNAITRTTVYDENTEWTVSTSNLTANANNTNNPFHLVKAIDVSSYTSSFNTFRLLNFTNSTTVDRTNYTNLVLYIRLKATYANNATIGVSFYNGINLVSNVKTISNGTYNFSRTISGTYQAINIPISDFTFTSSSFDRIRLSFAGAGAGMYIDYVQLQAGVPSPTIGNYVTNVFRKTGTDSVFQTINGVNVFAFKDSTGGGSQTWQQTLITGSTLTQNNTINGGKKDFIWNNSNQWQIKDSASNLIFTLQPRDGQVGLGDNEVSLNGTKILIDYLNDSIYYYSGKHILNGALRFANLGAAVSDTTPYKPLVTDAAGNLKRLTYWPSGGGGGTPTLQQVTTAGATTDQFVQFNNGISIDDPTFHGEIFLQGSGGHYFIYPQNMDDHESIELWWPKHDNLVDTLATLIDVRNAGVGSFVPLTSLSTSIQTTDSLKIWDGDYGHANMLYDAGNNAFVFRNSNVNIYGTLTQQGDAYIGDTGGLINFLQVAVNSSGGLIKIGNTDAEDPLIQVVDLNKTITMAATNGTTISGGGLDVQSTTGALLVPRMTSTQRDALTAAAGMMIFNTTINKQQTYNGSSWVDAGGSGSTNTSVGSGYKVAIDNTNNIKSLTSTTATGINLDSTTANQVNIKADTTVLATKWYAQNNLGYDTTRTGTYAQRIAITSPYTGYQFYQTDQKIGLWTYNGSAWFYNGGMQQLFFTDWMGAAASSISVGWSEITYAFSGTGANIGPVAVSGLNGNIGVFSAKLGTTGTSNSGFEINNAGNIVTDTASAGAGVFYFETINKLSALSDGTNTYQVWIGDTSSANVGYFFRYTDVQNSGKWQCIVGNGSTKSVSNTSITADNNWHIFGVSINNSGTGTHKFYIDGVLVSTITNIKCRFLFGFRSKIVQQLGSAQRELYFDRTEMYKY